ncbi:MAG TPA: hypothetical protein VHY91_04170 [Pirellulales bacterium]|jgi:hypothetical protein|nr:hypothetical protein [Pirellulales bacterium]
MMLAAFDTSTVLLLLGILVLWISLKRFGRRPAKTAGLLSDSRPASIVRSDDGHHLDAPAPVMRWEVAMHETARDLMGRLDSKIVIVEQLVRDANQAAGRLEAVLRRIEENNGRLGQSGSDEPDKIVVAEPRAAGMPGPDDPNPADS